MTCGPETTISPVEPLGSSLGSSGSATAYETKDLKIMKERGLPVE
jgi:hypothetical protein